MSARRGRSSAAARAVSDPDSLGQLEADIHDCRRCRRLVSWREEVARTKRRAYLDWTYWGRPVSGFGDPRPWLLVVGLAPAAHGANRTGRFFTGDRSGDFLFAALHRAGIANQAKSVSRDDGLHLTGAFITGAGRCAPPDNHPTPRELKSCAPFLDRELALLRPKVLFALGAIAWEASLGALERAGVTVPTLRPKFGHAAEYLAPDGPALVGCYHVSQQNTQTGRLTPAMFDHALARARELAGG